VKNSARNVVVEYKNKRARKGSASLWGSLDLKSISREVEAAISQSPVKVAANSGFFNSPVSKAENTAKDDLLAIMADENVAEVQSKREPSVIGALELEKEAVAADPLPKSGTYERIDSKHKNLSVGGTRIATSSLHPKMTTLSVADMDLGTELTLLESENASLKRELIAKLRLENDNLSLMLMLLDQRTAHKG